MKISCSGDTGRNMSESTDPQPPLLLICMVRQPGVAQPAALKTGH